MGVIRTLVATALFLVPVPGCILAAPPLRVGYGGIANTAEPEPAQRSSTAPEDDDERVPGELRVGYTPRATGEARTWDLSTGWVWTDRLDGPYAEVAWFNLASRDEEDRTGWRLGPSVLVEGLRHDGSGVGAAVGLLAEVYGELGSEGCGTSGCSAAAGELGIGIAWRAGTRQIDGDAYTYTTLSIELRTPGFIAIILD